MSMLASRLSCALAALVLFLVPHTAAAETPPTPEEVVQHCVQRMANIAENTAEFVAQRAQAGVQVIGALDANDAPAPVMVHAARNAKTDIARAGVRGTREVNETARRCLLALEWLDAPDAASQVVVAARAQALEAISGAVAAGLGAVDAALEEALADEDPPGGE